MPILDRMDHQYANLPMSLRLLLLIVRLLQVSVKVSSCGSSIDWQPGKGMWTLGGCIPKFGGWKGKTIMRLLTTAATAKAMNANTPMTCKS